jgi:hypothetical protein
MEDFVDHLLALLIRDVDPAAEKVPGRNAELCAGFNEAEEGVAAIAANITAGSDAGLPPCPCPGFYPGNYGRSAG